MSKSYEHAAPIMKELGYKEKEIQEKTSEYYFDMEMNGRRKCTVQSQFGPVDVSYSFNKNEVFNSEQMFIIKRDGYINDLDEVLEHAAFSVLYDKQLKAPQNEIDKICEGCTIHIIVGNFIIGEKVFSEKEMIRQKIQIVLPTRVTVTEGKEND